MLRTAIEILIALVLIYALLFKDEKIAEWEQRKFQQVKAWWKSR